MNSFVVIAILLYAAVCQAQDPITRVTVNQVRIYVTVTDRHGLAVRDLRDRDFHVIQDGMAMQPLHVQFVADGHNPAPPLARELRAGDVRRTIVLLIDDVGMSFEDFSRAKQAMSRYLQKSMLPGDLFAVLRTTLVKANALTSQVVLEFLVSNFVSSKRISDLVGVQHVTSIRPRASERCALRESL